MVHSLKHYFEKLLHSVTSGISTKYMQFYSQDLIICKWVMCVQECFSIVYIIKLTGIYSSGNISRHKEEIEIELFTGGNKCIRVGKQTASWLECLLYRKCGSSLPLMALPSLLEHPLHLPYQSPFSPTIQFECATVDNMDTIYNILHFLCPMS